MRDRPSLLVERLPGLLLALSLCAAPASAQQTAPAPAAGQDEVVSVRTHLVSLDVMVKGKGGRYVNDLRAEDFVVYENGVAQRVEFFDPPAPAGGDAAARGAGTAATAPSVSTSPGRRSRNIVSLVLDGQTTDLANLKQVREGVVRYIREQLGEEDAVALFAVTGGGLRLLHTFTRDRASLIAAVEKSYNTSTGSKTGELAAAGDTISQLQNKALAGEALAAAAAAPGPGQVQSGPALADSMMSNRVLQQFLQLRTILSTQQARPVLAALAAICEGLRPVPGRKTLVLFSQGFVSPAVLDWQVQRTVDIANRANVAIYVIDAAGLRASAPPSGALSSSTALGGISGLVSQEERIRGSGGENVFDRARFEGVDRQFDILYRVSEDSGGRFIKGTNDIAKGLERVGQEMHARYTLGYRSTNPNFDGGFRKVRLEVKRPDVEVVTRPGYYAIPPDEVVPLSPADKKLLAGVAAAEASPALPLAVELVPFRVREGLYKIPVAVELPPAAVEFEGTGDRKRLKLEVLGVVRESAEKVLARLGGSFDVALSAEQYQAILSQNIFYRQDVELPAGEYGFELIVRDGLSGKAAAKRARLVLPEAGPEFAMTEAVLSRHAEPAAAGAPDDLFRDAGVAIRPAPAREFRPADNLIIFFHLYNAAKDEATGRPLANVTVILTKDGQAVARPASFQLSEISAEPLPHLTFAKFLPLKDLAPGRYEAVIEARDMVTLKLLKQRAAFVIKP